MTVDKCASFLESGQVGEVVWNTDAYPSGYSSPIVVTVNDVRQAIFLTGNQLVSLSPKDGHVNCHAGAGQNGLNLETYDNFATGGNSSTAVVAGDGNNSLVVKRMTGAQTPQMPLGELPLNADQIQLFIDWIDAGAESN